MFESAKGIPSLPDITQASHLSKLGAGLISLFFWAIIIIVAIGVVIALINWSLNKNNIETNQFILLQQWSNHYYQTLKIIPHIGLVLALVLIGYFLCGTLSQRYHFWEQAKIEQAALSVSGDRLEQPAPQIRYILKETYTTTQYIEGKPVQVPETRNVDRYISLAGSQIEVKINQVPDPTKENQKLYQIDFSADYLVKNQLTEAKDFFFEATPPNGYSILSAYQVSQDNNKLIAVNPGDYGFPFKLEPQQETRFRVTYKAQGGPRWVYNANGRLLSNFRLYVDANFPNADFASGILPTETTVQGEGTRYTWTFNDNVSVQNPFGVFTSAGKAKQTGIIPRLLILAPILFIWWILLLYLSVPMTLTNVAIAAGIYFACILTLTYSSRMVNPPLAWVVISVIFLILTWGLGNKNNRISLAVTIATIAGAIMPIFGLITPTSGIILSLAGLLSVGWLSVFHWYRLIPIDHN